MKKAFTLIGIVIGAIIISLPGLVMRKVGFGFKSEFELGGKKNSPPT